MSCMYQALGMVDETDKNLWSQVRVRSWYSSPHVLAGSYSQPLLTQAPWQLPAGSVPISIWFSRMNF